MTNGSDKHHGPAGKKKAGTKKPKAKATAASLKRKNLLPSGLAATKPKSGN